MFTVIAVKANVSFVDFPPNIKIIVAFGINIFYYFLISGTATPIQLFSLHISALMSIGYIVLQCLQPFAYAFCYVIFQSLI